jgi:hypothetical protein
MALYEAMYHPPALVLLLSPTLRQSGELFRTVLSFYQVFDKHAPAAAETALRLELQNGSRIVSLPGTEQTVRGFSGVTLAIIDEASRVDDSLYLSVRPMLATSGGRLVALSTPFGKRGWFFDTWQGSSGAWSRVKVTADDCPRIAPGFLAEERAALGDWWFRQEYMCEFVETTDQLFTYDFVMSAVTPEVQPLFA